MMEFGSALWAGAQAAYTKASNAVAGTRFNREAYNEALGYDFENNDVDCNIDFDSEEEWTGVEKKRRRGDQPDEPYLVKAGTSDLHQLRLKVSKEAASRASEAAGVSMDYVKWALKLAAVEAARDIGFLTNCKTATDAVNAVKARFPVLEDIQAAYHSGSLEGSSRRSTSPRSLDPRQLSRSYEPQIGINHPYDVHLPSNLDDIPIIANDTMKQNLAAGRGSPIYHPEMRAEMELVLEPVGYGRGRARIRKQSSHKLSTFTEQKARSARPNQPCDREFDDVDLTGSAAGNDSDDMLGSVVLDDRLDFSGPIIGSVDSEEMKALEGNKAKKKKSF